MTSDDDAWKVSTDKLQIRWDPGTRVAVARVEPGVRLGAKDAADLVNAVTGWTSTSSSQPFAVLADGGGGHETDGKYRATLSTFIRGHGETATVTFYNLGPHLDIVVEMLRVGTGIPVHAFATQEEARAYLRSRGFAT
jgi:hypothetical protein